MADPFLSSILPVGWSFASHGYAFCDGQLLAINQNTSLYSLLGTTYGGDGRTTFALPDLRSRTPVHGPGSSYQGHPGGSVTVMLITSELPYHNHSFNCYEQPGNQNTPSGGVLAKAPIPAVYHQTQASQTDMNSAMIQHTGGSQPHNNLQPFLTINYLIATSGVYPSRN